MRFTLFFLAIASLLIFSQCQPTTDKDATGETETTTTADPAAAVPAPSVNNYPSITQEKMMNLYENCDYVDFVFYSTNFSMSQGDQPAIRATLSGVSTNPAALSSNCQPIGRVFFQIEGVNVEEADLFFSEGCLAYVFFEEGKYTYGNQLTQSGFDFYQKVLTQVQTQPAQ